MLLANIDRILKDDGVLVFQSSNFDEERDTLKSDLTVAGSRFWIAMPYTFRGHTALLASKKYHPTADIILQRSDLLDGINYYSTEMHHAAFVSPAYIHKELTGIARR